MASRLESRAARLLSVAAWIAAAALVCGCGGSAHPTASSGTLVGISERDFHITTTIAHVAQGDVTLRVHNTGPDEHELIVARERPGGLPLRADGFTINEDALQNSEPGSLQPQQPGHTENLKLHLAPGRYLLFCNMEGHFMGGMHTELVVSS
jgi:uncharacterized cupredoxin-like copper-binding protein